MTRTHKQILRRINRILHTPFKQLNPFIVILALLFVGLVIFLIIKVSFVRNLLITFFLGSMVVAIFMAIYRILRFFWRLTPQKIRRIKFRIPLKAIFITIGLALLAGIVIFSVGIAYDWFNQTNTRLTQLEARFGSIDKLECDPAKLPELLKPSIVRIIGNQSEGTGFAFSPNLIITNFHVIDKEPNPKIIFTDSKIAIPVEITGWKDMDLAILKTNETMPPLKLLSQTKSNIAFGEPVYSVGYPRGSDLPGPPMLSLGWYGGQRILYDDDNQITVTQTNTSLIPGMSGGPLVDACGNVIAINTAGEPGMSMYIDIDFAMDKSKWFSGDDVATLFVDPLTPEGAVKSFYDLINAARWQEAYNLIAPQRRQLTSFKEWQAGYTDTLHVDVIKSEYKDGKVLIKLYSRDWIDGLIDEKFFEGEWDVIFAGDVWNLSSSNIKQIPEPEGYSWWYE